MVKFSLISDMHIEFPQEKTPYDLLEKNVVVAGDTGNGLVGLKFLNKMRNKGFEVFACDGNHEHYANLSSGRTVYETSARFREENPSEGEMDGVPIILRNGWYKVKNYPSWIRMMNDSSRCSIDFQDICKLAAEEAFYIKLKLKEWKDYQLKGIVVTHTAPCEETLDPKYDGELSNEWYWNPYMRPLLEEFSDQIHVWCHGHTHARNEAVVDGVRVICNPRGYPGENPEWSPLTVEI